MMTLAAVTVSVVLLQSEFMLVDADTSRAAAPNMRSPILTPSEIAAVQYREHLPLSLPNAGGQVCYRSSPAGGTTCVMNSLPAFPLP